MKGEGLARRSTVPVTPGQSWRTIAGVRKIAGGVWAGKTFLQAVGQV